MKKTKKLLAASLLFIFSLTVFAKEDTLLNVGSFALPASQQPGPFLSIGQNIIESGLGEFYVLQTSTLGNYQKFIDLVPSILIGLSDQFSIFFNFPFALNYKQNNKHTSGLEDAFLQWKYAYYINNTSTFSDQATLLANISFPTGASTKEPPQV